MKPIFIILGMLVVCTGIASWCGLEMNRFEAGCYAITAGIMFISEASKVK